MAQLTEAPEVGQITDLEQGWRLVCIALGNMRIWKGDLAEFKTRNIYDMAILDGVIIAVQYRVKKGLYHVFAKVKQGASLSGQPGKAQTFYQTVKLAQIQRPRA